MEKHGIGGKQEKRGVRNQGIGEEKNRGKRRRKTEDRR